MSTQPVTDIFMRWEQIPQRETSIDQDIAALRAEILVIGTRITEISHRQMTLADTVNDTIDDLRERVDTLVRYGS